MAPGVGGVHSIAMLNIAVWRGDAAPPFEPPLEARAPAGHGAHADVVRQAAAVERGHTHQIARIGNSLNHIARCVSVRGTAGRCVVRVGRLCLAYFLPGSPGHDGTALGPPVCRGVARVGRPARRGPKPRPVCPSWGFGPSGPCGVAPLLLRPKCGQVLSLRSDNVQVCAAHASSPRPGQPPGLPRNRCHGPRRCRAAPAPFISWRASSAGTIHRVSVKRARLRTLSRTPGIDRDPGRRGFGRYPAGAFGVGERANGDLRRDGDTAVKGLRLDARDLAGDADGLRSLAGPRPRRGYRGGALCGGVTRPTLP